MSNTEQKCIAIRGFEINDEQLKIASKFRAFRLEAESTNGKLKEAETVIDRLKNELSFSRDAEKNLRSQVISGESRLICLQETLKKFLIVFAEQQRQNEKISQETEQKLEEFKEKLDQTRQKTQNLFKCISRNEELLEKNKKLKSTLAVIGNENDLMKIKIQNLIKEKKIMETEFQQKLKNLEDDLEKAVKKESESETLLLHYKEQIKDYEQKMECYEKERKSLLEDFEPPVSNSKKVVWTGSTPTLNAENRSLEISNSKKRSKAYEESDEECNTLAFQCLSFQGKPKRIRFKKEKDTNFSRMPKKQKPQLEFLAAPQIPPLTPSSAEFGRKRRLFSTNCNHYID